MEIRTFSNTITYLEQDLPTHLVDMEFNFHKDAYDMFQIYTIFCQTILLDDINSRWEYEIFHAWIISYCVDDTSLKDKEKFLLIVHMGVHKSSTTISRFGQFLLGSLFVDIIIWKSMKKNLNIFLYFSTITFFVFQDIAGHNWS